MPEYLFAYGTLRPRIAPIKVAHLVKKMRFMGGAYVHGRLYDMGSFPAAVLDPDCNKKIWGEVFQLPDDEATLSGIDTYEGYDPQRPGSSLFVRVKYDVTLRKDKSKLGCWLYVYNWPVSASPEIKGGNYLWYLKLREWKKHKELEEWRMKPKMGRKSDDGSGSENESDGREGGVDDGADPGPDQAA
jgi:gamma-glutamylcyclotransferase (GGCT)/AIG2-like uncharacterized protein YtfP